MKWLLFRQNLIYFLFQYLVTLDCTYLPTYLPTYRSSCLVTMLSIKQVGLESHSAVNSYKIFQGKMTTEDIDVWRANSVTWWKNK